LDDQEKFFQHVKEAKATAVDDEEEDDVSLALRLGDRERGAMFVLSLL
jgi:hypothetical protein